MELLVKVIGKEITTESNKFVAYSLLTAKQNWYRTAKISLKELKANDGQIVKAIVTRRFDKEYVKSDGTKGSFPTLVVEEFQDATDKEIDEFNAQLNKLNEATLKGVQ